MKVCAVMIILLSCAGRRQPDAPRASSAPSDDVAVIRRLLQHQEAAVRILELCRSRAARPELKQACTNGFDALQKRKVQLQGWERAWSGQRRNPPISHDDQYKSFYDLMRESKGEEFDEFAARAIRVHAREGLGESTACQDQATHPELKQFCSDLNSAQQRVVENARRWICDWFKDCIESAK